MTEVLVQSESVGAAAGSFVRPGSETTRLGARGGGRNIGRQRGEWPVDNCISDYHVSILNDGWLIVDQSMII